MSVHPFSVDSEVGRLREVIVHRPGTELSTTEETGDQHDVFAKQLVDQGVAVHHFLDLVAEALDDDGAREFLVERLATRERLGLLLAGAVAELVRTSPARRLARVLIEGMTTNDVATWLCTPSLVLDTVGADGVLLAPLPGHLHQRDSSSWIYGGLSVNAMAAPSRRRETLNARVVYNFHPMFRSDPPTFLFGNDSAIHAPATIEGGDVAVLGHRAVMVGMGARTTPQAVELLAHRLFEAGLAEQVIAVELPSGTTCTRLDQLLTQVDRDAYVVSPELPENLRSWHVTPVSPGLAVHEVKDLFSTLAIAHQVDTIRVLRVPTVRRVGAPGPLYQDNSFLAVGPGVVLGTPPSPPVGAYLANHGVEVISVDGARLGEGRGGPRRMTCPIRREA